MLTFPNCKINLGLNITAKRHDGYHTIETIFYPVNWCDALEMIDTQDQTQAFTFTQSGIKIDGNANDNLIYKAWKLLSEIKRLPPLKVHLHKNLPVGAGLGGGSADAAFFINLANQKFNLNLSNSQKASIASAIGSDCSFFIENQPVYAQGKGDEFSPVKINLSDYYIAIVYPNIHSNTKEAYNEITPKPSKKNPKYIIENIPIREWKNHLTNDFEETVFIKYPEIKRIKADFYMSGAIYACMSGSGSSVFGIFDKKPELNIDPAYSFYLQTAAAKIL